MAVRGQVILLTAAVVAVAVTAVLLLQALTSSAPGYGGARSAYGVFSRDISRAVEALAYYTDYVGITTLRNYTENGVRYGLVTQRPFETPPYANRTYAALNATLLFFRLNQAPLGLSFIPPNKMSYAPPALYFTSRGAAVVVAVRPLVNGTWGYTDGYYYGGAVKKLSLYNVVLSNSTVSATYRVSLLLNVSLLAISSLNITKEFSATARMAVENDAIYVNISVNRPYLWSARFVVYNRTVSVGETANLTYTAIEPQVALLNYTTYWAFYRLTVAGRLVEPVVKAVVGNVPMYLTSTPSAYVCRYRTGSSSIENRGLSALAFYNVSNAKVLGGVNVVRVDRQQITYWVIHQGGYLNITGVDISGCVLLDDRILTSLGLMRP